MPKKKAEKKAEKIARGIADKIECNTVDIDEWAEFWGFTREEYEEFLDTAIKAMEKESVLDKIRAEIVELTKCPYGTECLGANCPSNTDCMLCGDHVLEIIDRYKAESEV